MPHEFDGRNFAQILSDTRRLVTHGHQHEQDLAGLVALLEASGGGSSETASAPQYPIAASAFEWPLSNELLRLVRAACVAAQQQRELAERVLMALLGEARGDTVRPRILVVDDSEDNRALVAAVLEHSGFHTITAANGLDGVIAAHCVHPAAVVMDVTMPVLDGIEAARLLKASAATRSLDVIAYTARPEFYQGALTALFVGVLAKPATPEAIVAKVRESVPA